MKHLGKKIQQLMNKTVNPWKTLAIEVPIVVWMGYNIVTGVWLHQDIKSTKKAIVISPANPERDKIEHQIYKTGSWVLDSEEERDTILRSYINGAIEQFKSERLDKALDLGPYIVAKHYEKNLIDFFIILISFYGNFFRHNNFLTERLGRA